MINAVIFLLCSTGAILKAVEGDWGWVAIDTACAVVNAEPAYRWLKSRK